MTEEDKQFYINTFKARLKKQQEAEEEAEKQKEEINRMLQEATAKDKTGDLFNRLIKIYTEK